MARRIYLSVQTKGGSQEILVEADTTPAFLIGRDPEAQLFLNDTTIGRRHCEIRFNGAHFALHHLSEKGQTFINGDRVEDQRPIAPGDVLNVGNVVIVVRAERESKARRPEPSASPASEGSAPASDFGGTVVATDDTRRSTRSGGVSLRAATVSIGRDAKCDLTIDDLMVSREHARITLAGQGHVIEDRKSTNGVFVNGERIQRRTELHKDDIVDIGPYRFEYTGTDLSPVDLSGGTAIAVAGLGKVVPHAVTGEPLWLLKDINLSIEPGEFVGLMGESGCGKSTFMDAINGRRPGNHGNVYHDHQNLYKSFESLKAGIGYVPQQVIFHSELLVQDALRYSSRLRLSKDTSANEIAKNIEDVLNTVELTKRRDSRIHSLSGGQQKRVPLAMELLSHPRALFLDEVTSGLDIGTERRMMELFRELASDGMTIACITHFVDSLDIADKVAYFNQGRLCYYGPPQAMKDYFNFGKLSDIYFIDDKVKNDAEGMERHFQQSADYKRYVNVPEDIRRRETQSGGKADTGAVTLRLGDIKEGARGLAAIVAPMLGKPDQVIRLIKQPSDFKRQGAVLVRRYRQIFTLDKLNLAILIGLAPLVGLLLMVLGDAFDVGKPIFVIPDGTESLAAADERIESLWANQEWVNKQITMAFGAVLTMFFLGLFASVREIVKELDIYRHERFNSLQIVPYVLSKYAILAVLNATQALLILLVLDSTGAWTEGSFSYRFVILFATALAGTSLGLAISAAVPTSEWAVNLMIAVVIPQTLFAGAFVQLSGLSEWIGKLFVVTYWATEACRSLLPDIATTTFPDGIEKFEMMAIPLAVVAVHAILMGAACMIFLSAKDGPGVLTRLLRPIAQPGKR